MNNETNNKIPVLGSVVTVLVVVLIATYTPKQSETNTDWHLARVQGITQSSSELAISWGDLGARMVASGVIDKDKLESLYAQRGGLSDRDKKIVYGSSDENIVIDSQNAGMMLNMLWAFGLSNKNQILENGPMMDPKYGGAENFASTGGWTLARGDVMDHYSMHSFVVLSSAQQSLVERVAKNVYRPCCKNSTYFPDCNHGMAMLGLLELMASQRATENEMYQAAIEANNLWFPGQSQKTVGCTA